MKKKLKYKALHIKSIDTYDGAKGPYGYVKFHTSVHTTVALTFNDHTPFLDDILNWGTELYENGAIGVTLKNVSATEYDENDGVINLDNRDFTWKEVVIRHPIRKDEPVVRPHLATLDAERNMLMFLETV